MMMRRDRPGATREKRHSRPTQRTKSCCFAFTNSLSSFIRMVRYVHIMSTENIDSEMPMEEQVTNNNKFKESSFVPPAPPPELGFIVLQECDVVVVVVSNVNKKNNAIGQSSIATTTTTTATSATVPPSTAASSSSSHEWRNVVFCEEQEQQQQDRCDDDHVEASSTNDGAKKKKLAARSDDEFCKNCNLILYSNFNDDDIDNNSQQQQELTLKWNEVQPFHGLVSGISSCRDCINNNNSAATSTTTTDHHKRSDGALVFGMLRLLHNQVMIRSCKILFHNANENDDDNGNNDKTHLKNSIHSTALNVVHRHRGQQRRWCRRRRRRATIVITLTFPFLFPQTPPLPIESGPNTTTTTAITGGGRNSNKQRRSSSAAAGSTTAAAATSSGGRLRCIVPCAGGGGGGMTTTTTSRNLKPLHPAMQLLLSLIRSDWANLESLLLLLSESSSSSSFLENNNNITSRPKSLFPKSMSLDELYQRIQGSNSSSSSGSVDDCHANGTTSGDCCPLVHLPRDILVERLVPFLKAKSLDALRCTCTYLHTTLRACVPGLGLQLYPHQITSLSWMRDRETLLIQESDCFLSTTAGMRGCPDADLHRAVTAGQSVLLVQRPVHHNSQNSEAPHQNDDDDSDNRPIVSFRIKQSTGEEIPEIAVRDHAGPLQRNVARGGLLVDEPGLGKTITVLSLILQTSGLTTSFSDNANNANNNNNSANCRGRHHRRPPTDEDIIQLYWTDSVPCEYRQRDLLKLVNRLAKIHPLAVAHGHLPLSLIRRDIENDRYGANFSSFETEIKNTINSSTSSSDNEHVGSTSAADVIKTFQELVRQWKEQQLASARKSYSNASTKPNSRVAALFAQYQRQEFYNSLVQSSGTLIVIPHVLMEHWMTQIDLHVNLNYMTANGKKPLVFEYGRDRDVLSVDKAIIMTQLHSTHEAIVFFDHGSTRPLPPPDFLSKFKVVVTTSKRFEREWKNGSFQEELRNAKSAAAAADNDSADMAYERSFRQSNEACSLLKIHWLRMIVDEGHSMAKGRHSNTIQFASWISAERRWAMTGTPTKEGSVAIKQVYGLLRFLKHDFFTPRLDGATTWSKNVDKAWREGHLAAFFRLRSLLGLLMKRHTKLGIVPPPFYHEKIVPMSATEVTTYNVIVTVVQSNLLLTSMTEDAKQDSLLHPSQRKFALQTMNNVRRVCAGFSRNVTTLTHANFLETLQLAKYHHGFPESKITVLSSFLHGAEAGKLSCCSCCGMSGLLILLVMPCCMGLLCTECMDSKTTECPLCEEPFDVEDFQRFQPGFDTEWLDNVNDRVTKSTPQSSVTNAVVGQVANGIPNGPNNHLELVAHADGNNRPPTGRSRRIRHICQYDSKSTTGKCTICREEHDRCNLAMSLRCNICHRVAQECSPDETKPKYLVDRILSMYKEQVTRIAGEAGGRRSRVVRPLKVIVFSQYQKALNLVGDRLLGRLGTACVAEYFGKYRTEELHRFTVDEQCFCLLLSKDGSEGLDLSFVTHIFFVEEIWDQSLADQAVARAWRMGAKGQVEVETLIAKNTVEETMKELEEESLGRIHHADSPDGKRGGGAHKEKDDATISKTHFLLKRLRLITDYHQFANSNSPTNSNMSNSSTSPEDAARIWQEGMQKRKREEEEDEPSVAAAAQAVKSKTVRFAL